MMNVNRNKPALRLGSCTAWVCVGGLGLLAATVSRLFAGEAPAEGAASPEGVLELSTFACDVTPPEGHPLCGGWIKPVVGVDDPELAKGVVLRDGGGTYVLCVIDWCELRNEAYDLFRTKLADAAGTTPERVAVHCLHAHNAPITDRRAQEILGGIDGAPVHADLAFLDVTATKAAQALRDGLGRTTRISHVGTARARVDRVASNRRVKQPDGTIKVRYSSTKDTSLHEAPEGLIDPWLRTVAFYAGDRLVACLHYYATHPQSYYGDGRATYDVPGIARERVEKQTGAFQLYFTGCAGNVTMGKYNDGTPPRRIELAGRLQDAMVRSMAALERRPVSPIAWRIRPVRFPLRKEPAHSEEARRKTLIDPGAALARIDAALGLSTLERCRTDRPFELTCLQMGSIRLVHLPGEPFVEFQLEAQELHSDLFVAVAGYADCGMGYICTEASYAEGGYEPTATFLDPVSERYFRRAIRDLLAETPALGKMTVKSVRRIWDAAPHSAFTDLLRHGDRWLCTFREGAGHVSPEGAIRVIRSADGESWESAALIRVEGVDLRDPKLSVTPDGRVMLVGGWSVWRERQRQELMSWVAFSEDGSTWTSPKRILAEGEWLWRVLWHQGRALGVAYGKRDGKADGNVEAKAAWSSRLYASADGVEYQQLASFAMLPGLTEATLRAGSDGRLHCLHRRDQGTSTALVGTSREPYVDWTWRDTGFYFGGPNLMFHGGRWLAAGRWMVGAPRTVLAAVDFEDGTLEPILHLPSGGDTSYPGLASRGQELWISYYSSHEGKTAIYLARVE